MSGDWFSVLATWPFSFFSVVLHQARIGHDEKVINIGANQEST